MTTLESMKIGRIPVRPLVLEQCGETIAAAGRAAVDASYGR
jgi:hypothetical protein